MRLKAGDKFPEFVFSTGYKDDLNSLEVIKDAKKTVFWVLRYIGCTVCRYDVKQIADNYQKFTDKDAQVYVVMQSDRRHIQEDLERSNTILPFEIISDPDMRIYKLFEIGSTASKEELSAGVTDELKEKVGKAREAGFVHGDYEGDEMQLPAMFIAGQDGTVEYVNYARNIMDMPKLNEVLELL